MAASNFLFVGAIASICVGLCVSVGVVISPEKAKATETDLVQITCDLSTNATVKSVVTVQVVKDGSVTVAMATSCEEDNCAKSALDHVQAKGKLGTPPSLELTLSKPKSEDAGEYSCVINFLDDQEKLKEEKGSATLDVEKLDDNQMEQVLDNLKERVEKLESGAPTGTETVPNINPTGGQAPAATVRDKLVVFSVTNNKEYRAVRGSRLALPNIITMEGPGYDLDTGIFTAPWRGLYSFSLSVGMAGKASSTVLQVKHNKNVLFRLYAADKSFDDQMATSTAVFLEAGDVVFAFIEACTGSKLYDNRRYTVFTGFLVHPME